MDIQPFSPDLADEWDAFVEASPEAWLFHLTSWQRIEGGTDRAVSFVVRDRNRIVAVCPLYRGRRTVAGVIPARVLHSGSGRGGIAVGEVPGVRQRREVLRIAFSHIDDLARRHRIHRLEMRLPTLAPAYLPPRRPTSDPLAQVRPLTPFRFGRSLRRGLAVDRIVDCALGEAAIWSALDKDCRSAIRKAQASGVTVSAATAREAVREYHRLHVANYRRSGAAPLPIEHFERLWDGLHATGRLHLLLAHFEGQAIGGVLMLRYKGAATYWAGTSAYEFQALRANNLLVWEAIRFAIGDGCRWFELGPTFPSAEPTSKLARIGRFKEQFGGQVFGLFEGTFDWWPAWMAVLDTADAVAASGVERLRRFAGRSQ